MKLDGEALSRKIKIELKQKVARLRRDGLEVGLAVIRVGSDPASELYVTRKIRACKEVGIRSWNKILPDTISIHELLDEIEQENEDPETSGILVQLPLPAGIDTQAVIEKISPSKDVDGFHPFNVGRVATGVGGFPPCTPKGAMRLLDEYGIDMRGKKVVLVGASRIVGRPLVGMLLDRMATVTVCQEATKDLAEHTRDAEIIFVAVGKPNLITRDMVSHGVVIVDIGINRIPDSRSPRGFRVVGDCAANVRDVAYAWTPVPGGIGPMTVTMLLENTIIASEAISKNMLV